MRLTKSLLWIDCIGGLAVGAFVIVFSEWLSALYGFPTGVVLVMGTANLLYGSFSFSLARRAVRPRAWLRLLSTANITWGVTCAMGAALLAAQATPIGLATLIVEGLYVGGLGILEWRNLEALLTAD